VYNDFLKSKTLEKVLENELSDNKHGMKRLYDFYKFDFELFNYTWSE